jgi:aquaporin Z
MRKYLAELVGTFILVMVGTMTVVAWASTDSDRFGILSVVPWGFGLGLLAAVFAVGHISGGHFNPAVTIAMLLDKRMPSSDVAGYLVAQFAGATLASAILVVLSDREAVAGTANSYTEVSVGLVSEIVLTLIFVLVILMVTKTAPGSAGIVIPLTLAGVHLAGIPFSGASVNPARSFGPALVGGDLSQFWVYVVGPIVGAVGAFILWKVLGSEEG